mmetsp:Transcript_37004/g.102859  ORF Transcript_37004/g.102859 Transcript_37004/m.102859 type:complete len:391 (-) Transcript_37004:564-1736(-)
MAMLLAHSLERVLEGDLLVLDESDGAEPTGANDANVPEVRQGHIGVSKLEALDQLLPGASSHQLVKNLSVHPPEQCLITEDSDSRAPRPMEEQGINADIAIFVDGPRLLATRGFLQLPLFDHPALRCCLTVFKEQVSLCEPRRPEGLDEAIDLVARQVLEGRDPPREERGLDACNSLLLHGLFLHCPLSRGCCCSMQHFGQLLGLERCNMRTPCGGPQHRRFPSISHVRTALVQLPRPLQRWQRFHLPRSHGVCNPRVRGPRADAVHGAREDQQQPPAACGGVVDAFAGRVVRELRALREAASARGRQPREARLALQAAQDQGTRHGRAVPRAQHCPQGSDAHADQLAMRLCRDRDLAPNSLVQRRALAKGVASLQLIDLGAVNDHSHLA